jgi:hypothetical protein
MGGFEGDVVVIKTNRATPLIIALIIFATLGFNTSGSRGWAIAALVVPWCVIDILSLFITYNWICILPTTSITIGTLIGNAFARQRVVEQFK